MTRLRTVLIQTPCFELHDDRLEPPLGLMYLATWANLHGHQTSIVDLSSVPAEEWQERLPAADVYGFTTYTTTYDRTLRVLRAARRVSPAAWTVAGGPHASALPEIVSRDFDTVVVGEGEAAFLEVLELLGAGYLPPSVMRGRPIEDLDSIPPPDFALTDIGSYRRVVDGRPSLSVLTARGCPYQCVFCNSNVVGPHNRVRFRSADHVVGEIRGLKEKWDVNAIRFQDDTFTLNLPRLRRLTDLLTRDPVSYRCFGRVDRCRPEVAELLARGGCRHVSFGVESGSDEILRRMRKGQTADDIRHGIASARAAGLIVRVFLIVGFPGETWETVDQTVDLMLECHPDEFAVYPLIPYPGTALFRDPGAFGITNLNPDFTQYFQVRRDRGTGYVMTCCGLEPDEVASMRTHIINSLEPSLTWAGDSRAHK